MVERDVCDRKLYKIPSDEVLENRREFYGLTRRMGETIEKWLYRVFSHIDDCDFPKSVEYILTDKFVCELDSEERAFIRKADPNWTMTCEVSNETNATDDVDQPVELDSNIHMSMSMSSNPTECPSPIPSTSTSMDLPGETTLEQSVQADDGIEASIKIFKCKKCNAEHSDQKAYTKHIKTAHRQRRHPCKVCDRSFFVPSELKRHALTHKKEKLVFCNRCHKGFTRLARLIEHKKNVHSSICGAHSCCVCGKRFNSRRDLKRHEVVHNGKKRYECGVCQKGFNVLYHMKRHTKVMHHGFWPYSCGVCREKFRSIYFMKKHLNEKHLDKCPFTCNLCEKAFIHAAALIQHKSSVHKEPSENHSTL